MISENIAGDAKSVYNMPIVNLEFWLESWIVNNMTKSLSLNYHIIIVVLIAVVVIFFVADIVVFDVIVIVVVVVDVIVDVIVVDDVVVALLQGSLCLEIRSYKQR